MTQRKKTPGIRASIPPAAPSRGSRAPAPTRGARTLSLGSGSAAAPSRSTGAPRSEPWAERARVLSAAVAHLLEQPRPDPAAVARLDRAWEAWELGGAADATIAQVAHLIDRAWAAMNEPPRPHPEPALQGAAHILYNGLPRAARDRVDYPQVLKLVRRLEQEPELWPAVVRGTAELLGWTGVAFAHAGHVIRIAQVATSRPVA